MRQKHTTFDDSKNAHHLNDNHHHYRNRGVIHSGNLLHTPKELPEYPVNNTNWWKYKKLMEVLGIDQILLEIWEIGSNWK